jgi:hypothetical protein
MRIKNLNDLELTKKKELKITYPDKLRIAVSMETGGLITRFPHFLESR